MREVSSSSIAAVGHDGTALLVRFRSGETYRYPGAPASHVREMADAVSAGRYFQDHIRPHHRGEKVAS